MTFEELFLKSAQAYFKGKSWTETDKLSERKYTKDFFDKLEERTTGEEVKVEEEDDNGS